MEHGEGEVGECGRYSNQKESIFLVSLAGKSSPSGGIRHNNITKWQYKNLVNSDGFHFLLSIRFSLSGSQICESPSSSPANHRIDSPPVHFWAVGCRIL